MSQHPAPDTQAAHLNPGLIAYLRARWDEEAQAGPTDFERDAIEGKRVCAAVAEAHLAYDPTTLDAIAHTYVLRVFARRYQARPDFDRAWLADSHSGKNDPTSTPADTAAVAHGIHLGSPPGSPHLAQLDNARTVEHLERAIAPELFSDPEQVQEREERRRQEQPTPLVEHVGCAKLYSTDEYNRLLPVPPRATA
ncbi:hypothetical protein [Streptomyces sp. NBRC 109706]|uniref:hypothetical protein n=1 Tax=Streptomyces sp. NBRC 109706 TaxID=1550035 RepID=UPI0007823CA5|nr:hypothetical protein [Streptomyces sp. NBRC 109706]